MLYLHVAYNSLRIVVRATVRPQESHGEYIDFLLDGRDRAHRDSIWLPSEMGTFRIVKISLGFRSNHMGNNLDCEKTLPMQQTACYLM
ncbi:hypothetical protein RvY_16311 [Ramazzottius varieornatus]|uniref:Uncharacterized protein n=1 Tax=Ramazzottius varieornatus TaxID=947166 RepID=A0A1D1VXZ8_RAMVA|nr:hypothetical protein RvY_16311 [Ramazzottius varieornatus]